jgi:2,4-dienoyl-CoA reductase-like NADH-dependent reductase (Old Yellow Enzyme family)
MKRVTKRPVITVGSIGLSGPLSVTDLGEPTDATTDFSLVARRLTEGEFDLVAVGRALLVDPAWARKVKEGRLDELMPFSPDALEYLS